MTAFRHTRSNEVIVRTAPDFLQRAFEKLRRLLQPARDAGYDTSRVYLILDEVLSNVYKHGYKRVDGQPIGVQLEVRGERCVITSRDLAPTFDSARHARTRVLPDPESGSPGGRGLVIVNRMCESFEHYAPPEGGNMLRMVMKLIPSREVVEMKPVRARKTEESRS